MSGRNHLVSLLATGLSLVLGVGLGAGLLSEREARDAATRRAAAEARAQRLAERVERLAAERAVSREVVAALAAPLIGDRLRGRTAVVVATPGAPRSEVRRAQRALTETGATVTGVLTLTETYVDPERAQSPLEDLALRLVPPGVEFADGASPIQRVGTVLARALVQRPDGQASSEPDQDAAEVLAGLDELGALRFHGTPGVRAETAVVVTGEDPDTAAEAVTGLVAALDAGSRGAVVAGPGDGRSGPLRWVRDRREPGLSGAATVDHADTTAGRVALVLALLEQLGGGSGDYGTGRRAGAVIPKTALGQAEAGAPVPDAAAGG